MMEIGYKIWYIQGDITRNRNKLSFAIIYIFKNFIFRVQKLWLKIEEKLITCCQLGGSTKTGIEEKTMAFKCFYVFSFYKV